MKFNFYNNESLARLCQELTGLSCKYFRRSKMFDNVFIVELQVTSPTPEQYRGVYMTICLDEKDAVAFPHAAGNNCAATKAREAAHKYRVNALQNRYLG